MTLLGCGIIQHAGEPEYFALSVSSDVPIAVYNLNRYGILFHSGSTSKNLTALLAEAGDLLHISTEETGFYYRYNPKDGQHLLFSFDPDSPFKTFLNGRLISLSINDDPIVWEWLEDCDIRSLQHLQSLHIALDKGSPNLVLLQKIASARTNIGLSFEGDFNDPFEIIALFTPSWLAIPGPLDFDENVIPKLKKLECLFGYTSENMKFVEELPHLETLILWMEDDAEEIQFNRITKLRSLTLCGYNEIRSLADFSNNNRLRNLYLISCDIEDFSPVTAFSRLTGLGLWDCEVVVDLSELQKLSHILWFSFPPEVSQRDFSVFLSQHPDLKVIDLLGCDEITDLSPLSRLTEIQGLTLDLPLEDLSPLYQLKKLEVLIFEEDMYNEEDYQNLRAALPDTQIAIGGYCLGSGWLLLVIPIIVIGRIVIQLCRKRSSR